jgi:hypothetical protein
MTSRRGLLACTLAAAVLRPPRVSAQTKATQQDAQYQPTPKAGMKCAMCQLFRPPRACQVVAGDIASQGWCKFFSLPD